MKRTIRLGAFLTAAGLLLAACGSDDDTTDADDNTDETSESTESETAAPTESVLDASLFNDGALSADPVLADCTLSDGTETQCYELAGTGTPAGYEVGPFCPTTTDADASEGGIWLDGENVYDLDGEFILSLAEIYGDDNWKLYNDDGTVNITESAEEFELAARPDVDESLQNHCVEGKFEWLDGGEPFPYTATIPATPTLADASSSSAVLGITINGIRIDGQAPVDAILGAYTIAAFDDCGGHFNPAEGYHMHAATDCASTTVDGGDAPLFGFATDGFPILLQIEDRSDLDDCGGHSHDEVGYHYHASAPEDNAIIGCLSGVTLDGGTDAGGRGGPPDDGERPAR